MAATNKVGIQATIAANIRSGLSDTTALELRQLLYEILDSYPNVIDDKNANNGYLGIDGSGRVNVSFINSATPLGKFVRDDGTFAYVGAVNGLSPVTGNVELGGPLTKNTTISQAGYLMSFSGNVVLANLENANSSDRGVYVYVNDVANTETKTINFKRNNAYIQNVSNTNGNFKFGYDNSGSYSEWRHTNTAGTYRNILANYVLGFFNGFSFACDKLSDSTLTQMIHSYDGYSLSYDNFSRFAVKVDRTNPNGEGIFQSPPTYAYTGNLDAVNGIIGVNSTGEFFRTGVTAAQLASIVSGGVTSVSGTTNRITSTGGTTPVIDISSSYVGQNSITTLGTIGTGTWNGSAVAPNYGGTGLVSYDVGDLLYANGTTSLTKLASVSAGSYLRSGGVTTAPVWSTLKLPNTSTANYVLFSDANNNVTESSNFQFNNSLNQLYSNRKLLVGATTEVESGVSIEAINGFYVRSSSTANTQVMGTSISGGYANFFATYYGSSSYLPMKFRTSDTDRILIATNGNVNILQKTFLGGTTTPTANADLSASTTAAASLRIRSGVAPTSPNDGDIWQDGTDIKIRIGGVTKTFTLV